MGSIMKQLVVLFLVIAALFDRTSADHFHDEEPCNVSIIIAFTQNSFYELVRVDIESDDVTRFTPSLILPGVSAVAADQEDGLVFFTDVSLEYILKRDFKTPEATTPIVRLETDSLATGIAVDPVLNKIFYTDYEHDIIGSLDYDGSNHEVILNVIGPRGITVDPNTRKLYVTTWTLSSQISSLDYSGNNFEVLLDSDIIKPSGLAIDFEESKLYWCDYDQDTISVIYLNGTGRQTIYQRESLYPDLDFWEIMLYHNLVVVSEWITKSVYLVPKDGGVLLIPFVSLSKTDETESGQPNGMTQICVPVNESLIQASTDGNINPTRPPSTISTIATATRLTTTTAPTTTSRSAGVTTSTTVTVLPATATPSSTSAPATGESTTQPDPPANTDRNSKNDDSKESNPGLSETTMIIIGVAVGGGLIFTIIISISVYCCIRISRSRSQPSGRTGNTGPVDFEQHNPTFMDGSPPYNPTYNAKPWMTGNSAKDIPDVYIDRDSGDYQTLY